MVGEGKAKRGSRQSLVRLSLVCPSGEYVP